MTKTDKSIKNVCIAAIKRKTIQPYDFVSSEFYDDQQEGIFLKRILSHIDLMERELAIAATYYTANWTLVTTRRIITFLNDELYQLELAEIKQFSPGMSVKSKNAITYGTIIDANNKEMPCLIETGRASMVIIYAIDTCLGLINGGK